MRNYESFNSFHLSFYSFLTLFFNFFYFSVVFLLFFYCSTFSCGPSGVAVFDFRLLMQKSIHFADKYLLQFSLDTSWKTPFSPFLPKKKKIAWWGEKLEIVELFRQHAGCTGKDNQGLVVKCDTEKGPIKPSEAILFSERPAPVTKNEDWSRGAQTEAIYCKKMTIEEGK